MTIHICKILLLSGFLMISLCGCDPVARHKVLTTIFDGVPNPPPPEQVCADYAEKRMAELRDELSGKKAADLAQKKKQGSEHMPYVEKRCDDCHDKTKESGLVTAKKDLCLYCHTGFIKGTYVHGPVATGDCTACHEPHNAEFPFLLKKNAGEVCALCHLEKRTASVMHSKVAAQKLVCTDCHDPHSANAPFFLK